MARVSEADTQSLPSSTRVTTATHTAPPETGSRVADEAMAAPRAWDVAAPDFMAIPIEGDPGLVRPLTQPLPPSRGARADMTPHADAPPHEVVPSRRRRVRIATVQAPAAGPDDCRQRALALWPGLDRDRLRRTGGEVRRVARLVEKRTALSFDTILGMLTDPGN